MNRIKLLVLSAAAAAAAATTLVASAAGPNLISNNSFSSDVSGWDNYGGNPGWFFGSMAVTNNYTDTGNSYSSGWYCVKNISAGTEYTAKIQALVAETAPEHTGAMLALHYYASNDCSGSNLVTGGGSQKGGFVPADRGKWIDFSFNSVAPATAKSVRVRATAVKQPVPPGSSIATTTVVLFDNAYFGKKTGLIDTVDLPDDVLQPLNPTATPTPKPKFPGPGGILNPTNPTATPTPKPKFPGPGGILNPTNPTATPTPPQDDPQDDPQDQPGDQPQDNPQDQPGDQPQDNPQDQPSDNPQDQPQDGPKGSDSNTQDVVEDGGPSNNPQATPGVPDTGNSGNGGVSPATGLGYGLVLVGLGAGAIAMLAATRLKRRDDEETR